MVSHIIVHIGVFSYFVSYPYPPFHWLELSWLPSLNVHIGFGALLVSLLAFLDVCVSARQTV